MFEQCDQVRDRFPEPDAMVVKRVTGDVGCPAAAGADLLVAASGATP